MKRAINDMLLGLTLGMCWVTFAFGGLFLIGEVFGGSLLSIVLGFAYIAGLMWVLFDCTGH